MTKPPLQLYLSNLRHGPLYRSGLTAAVYAVRVVCRLERWKYIQSVTRDTYICTYVLWTDTGGLWQRTNWHSRQRRRYQTDDSIQYTDLWTPGQTERLSVVTSLFSTSLGIQMVKRIGADGRQDHDVQSVGTAGQVYIGKTRHVTNLMWFWPCIVVNMWK